MVEQIFFSPQLKRNLIISKDLIYIRIATHVVKQLKTYDLKKLGNIRKKPKLLKTIA